MATFFMFGNYTPDAVRKISINRTEQTIDMIEKLGGKVKGIYALLGEYDLLFCVNLPDIEAAAKASISMSRLTGIAFRTCSAIKIEVFDRLVTE